MTRLKSTLLSRPPATRGFIITLALLALMGFVSDSYWSNWNGFAPFLAASRKSVFASHEYWRLVTTTFVHGDVKHLASNAYMFMILGAFVAGYFGVTTLLTATLVISPLVNALSLSTYDASATLIGASGLVYILAGFWFILYLGVDRRRTQAQRLIRTVGVGLLILFPTSFEPEVSYRTHAIGLALGLLYGGIYFLFNYRRLWSYESYEAVLDEDLDPFSDWGKNP